MIRILENILSDQIISALGYTFLHSLWIGACLSLILFLFLMIMRRSDPRKRYTAGVLALLAFLFANILVFVLYVAPGSLIQDKMILKQPFFSAGPLILQDSTLPLEKGFFEQAMHYFEKNQALLVLFWLTGIMLLGLRFLGGLIYSQRLKSYGAQRPGGNILQSARQIAERLGITREIPVLASRLVRVPIVLGYLKPVILIPASVLLQIPQDQIEAILSHELAHIRRKDNLVNLLQTIIEIIFFYHPASWWISGLIRKEREEICDDMAVGLCPDRLIYAKALMNLENARREPGVYAVGFTGRKNTLLNRIKRLMMKKEGKTNYFAGLLVSLVILTGLALLSGRADAFGPGNKQVINTAASHFDNPGLLLMKTTHSPDTLKNEKEPFDNSYISYSADHDGKNVVIQIVDGELKLLAIDGKEIEPEHYDDYKELIEEINSGVQSNKEERAKERELRRIEREKMLEERRAVEEEMQEEMHVRRVEKKIIMDSLRKNHQERAERMRTEFMEQHRLQKEEMKKMIEEQIEQLEKIKNDTNLLKEYYGIGRRKPHLSGSYIYVPRNEEAYEYKFFNEPDLPKLPEMPELPEMEENAKWFYLEDDNKSRIYIDVEKDLKHPNRKEIFMDDSNGNVIIFKTPADKRPGFNESLTRQRLRNELKKDELIDFFHNKEVYLSKKELIVDGEKQPRKLMKKYRDMYEALSGREIGKDEIIEIQ